jgi:predicted nucleic acid-binding protein
VHALLEAFSVLTRLPGRHRLNPDDTLRLLRANFPDLAEVVGLSPEHAWSSIQRLAAHALGGGRVYDAAIATAAWQAGARLLLTWNTRDFLAVAPPGLEVREPSRTG